MVIVFGAPGPDLDSRVIHEKSSTNFNSEVCVMRNGTAQDPKFFKILLREFLPQGPEDITFEFWPGSREFENIRTRSLYKYWLNLGTYLDQLIICQQLATSS